MFQGCLEFAKPEVLSGLFGLSGFMTAVLYFAQDDLIDIPILDIMQTFFCWPSFFEGCVSLFCLWSFRHVERILGVRGFAVYMIYNALTYSIPFIVVVTTYGFRQRFSMLNFVPYSLFVFTLWRVPAVMLAPPVTDKMAVSLAMVIVFLAKFPCSIFALVAALVGYWAWTVDIIRLRRLSAPVQVRLEEE